MLDSRYLGPAGGLALDGAGNAFAAGDTAGELDGNVNLGITDVFVLKYGPDGAKR